MVISGYGFSIINGPVLESTCFYEYGELLEERSPNSRKLY